VDVLYGDYTWIDQTGRLLQNRREIEFSQFVLSYHRVLYIPTTATFFRRRIFDEGNFIDPRFHYAMDYEFFLRLAEKGYRFRHLPGLLADFRWHALSKSASQSRKQRREHDEIAKMYSAILKPMAPGLKYAAAKAATRFCAAARRYAEKFLRGYYFEQFRVS
jgi:GT2 family glycosyltransferase